MRRTSFEHMSCSIARSLEWIGDWWTLLIVREAFYGSRRFGEFEQHLGIAPNVLTQRLARLVEAGILEVTSTSGNGRALEYRLTDKGRDLLPVLVALMQWGDRHAAGPHGPAVSLVERRSGKPLAPLVIRAPGGRALQPRDVAALPGPGATEADRARLQSLLQVHQGTGLKP